MTHQPMTNDATAKAAPSKQAVSRLQSSLQLPPQLGRNRSTNSLIQLRCAGRVTRGQSSCCTAACVAVANSCEAAKHAINLAFIKMPPNCVPSKISPPSGGRPMSARLATGGAETGTRFDRLPPPKPGIHKNIDAWRQPWSDIRIGRATKRPLWKSLGGAAMQRAPAVALVLSMLLGGIPWVSGQ